MYIVVKWCVGISEPVINTGIESILLQFYHDSANCRAVTNYCTTGGDIIVLLSGRMSNEKLSLCTGILRLGGHLTQFGNCGVLRDQGVANT